MSAVFEVLGINAASAVALAVIAGVAGRYVRRPAVVHALWVVVLLQLFMPPVLRIGVLPPPPIAREVALRSGRPADLAPRSISVDAGEAASTGTRVALELAAAPPESRYSTPVDLGRLATAIWLVGAALVFGLAFTRAGRFRRLLKTAETRNPALEVRLRRLSRRMAVRAPRLRLVGAPISPLIWPRLRGAELLFPSGLLNRLDASERDALLAHELAHVARRDHWVRFLELFAVSLFWWHPVVWWARSRLRLAEERCCDQRVLRVMRRDRPSYARGLLKTVEFLAGTGRRSPALASGVGEVRNLEDRLTMIMKDRPPESLSTPRRVVLALCAASALLVFPTWTDRGPAAAAPDGEASDAGIDASEQAYRNTLLELETQAMALESELREVREHQRALEREWGRAASSSEPAAAYEEAIAAREQEMQRVVLREEREHRAQARIAEVKRALRRTMLEREAALTEGDLDRAEDLKLEVEELEQYLRQVVINRELEARHLERQLIEVQLDRLVDAVEAHRAAGQDDRAERLEAEARAMREDLRREHERRAREIEDLERNLDRERVH